MQNEICSICLCTPKLEESLRLSCDHVVCTSCGSQASFHGISSCPLCRMPHLLDVKQLRNRLDAHRQDYRSWRTGGQKGAAGELRSVTSGRISLDMHVLHLAGTGVLEAPSSSSIRNEVQHTRHPSPAAIITQEALLDGTVLQPAFHRCRASLSLPNWHDLSAETKSIGLHHDKENHAAPLNVEVPHASAEEVQYNSFLVPTSDQLHQLHVEVYGSAGPHMLLIHSGPGFAASAKQLREIVANNQMRLVTFHQRGVGLSRPRDSLERNTLDGLLEDCEDVRRACGVRSWQCVAGRSYAAAAALLYAKRRPDAMQKLCLCALSPLTQTCSPEAMNALCTRIESGDADAVAEYEVEFPSCPSLSFEDKRTRALLQSHFRQHNFFLAAPLDELVSGVDTELRLFQGTRDRMPQARHIVSGVSKVSMIRLKGEGHGTTAASTRLWQDAMVEACKLGGSGLEYLY